jgi:hypothetical protein
MYIRSSTGHRAFGYTLIEIGIALAVITVLMAITIRGAGLLDSGRIANIVAIARDLGVASNTFKERYKYWPGDLPFAANDIPNIPAACNLDPTVDLSTGDGLINTATETACVIDELVAADLIKAEPDPANPGRLIIRSGYGAITVRSAGSSSVTNFPAATKIAQFANLPCEIVRKLDAQIDDGDIASTSNGRAKSSVASCVKNTTNDPVPFYAIAIN